MKYDIRPFRNTDLGLLLIRVIVAVVAIFHGGQKLFGIFGGYGLRGTAGFMAEQGFPLPMASTIAIGSIEFFGGILIALGLYMRVASLLWSIGMFIAAFVVHGGAFSLAHNGMEFALTLAIVLLGLFFTGPGRFSISGR